MTDWKKKVAQLNKERFKVPTGWDTKDQVAANLECSPERVADLLKPGLQAGEIERQDFPVWDEGRRLTVRITCYRMVDKGEQKKAPKASAIPDDTRTARIVAAIKRYPDLSDWGVSRKLSKVGTAEIAAVRAQIKKR